MAEEQSGEKTEKPTERRRQQAREKGDRLTSRELATAMSGVAGALWMAMFAGSLAQGLRQTVSQGLALGQPDLMEFRPLEHLLAILSPLWVPLGALAGMILTAVLIGQALSGGLSLTPGHWQPKMSRMNPLAGLKRMFGPKGLIELAKAGLKAAILISVSLLMIRSELPMLLTLSRLPFDAALSAAAEVGLRLFLWLSLGLVLIAGADLPVQLLQWLKRMRMTKQEVKDELKQQEGSPEMKYAMRRMAREGLKRASRAAMADATVVLTNPTHFAVALRYRPDVDAAPVIVARGRGLVAEVIRELASELQVPILSYPSVARGIYFTGKVGHPIRTDLYVAVATILAFVLRVGQQMQQPEVEAPDTAHFDGEGRRITPDG